MYKNVASQKVTFFAFDATTNLPVSGDAANITAYVDKDDAGVTVLADTTATEKDATNAKGFYIFDLAQAETNGDKLLFSAKSSTANVVVIAVPPVVYTLPPNFTGLTITAGVANANLTQIDGLATNGNNATLNLKQLNCVNNAGHGIVASATGTSGHGIAASAAGTTRNGIHAVGGAASGGGAAGHGINALGGSANTTAGDLAGVGIKASGGPGAATTNRAGEGVTIIAGVADAAGGANGISSTATGNFSGAVLSGAGSGAGVQVTGGATGAAMQLVGGGTSGDGLLVTTTSGHGFSITASGTSKHGISATGSGGGSGAGLLTSGGTNGPGLQCLGGATSGDGLVLSATSGNGATISATGTSKHGVSITGGTAGTSDGLKAVAGTGGVPIRGDLTGNITGNLSGSVGSVTALSAAAVQAIWDAATSALTTAGSIGKALLDNWTTILGRLTAARAGYLDNLNVGGNVASSAEATAIQNNTRVVRVVPDDIELPAAGTRTYRIELLLYDAVGNMEAPDSAPTIALVNQAGTDRSGRLDSTTMALVETGRYRAIYTSTAGDTKEQLVWTFSVVEGGATRKYGNTSYITDAVATDFTSADRAKLDTLHDTRLTASRAANLDNLDAAITSRMATFVYTAPLDAAGTRAAIGLASANLDTQLTTIDDFLDTEIAAIKAKTDNLPASPAAVGSAMTLTGGERNSVADAVLTRDVSNVEGTANDHSLCYVVLASSEFEAIGTVLTVKKTDGSTFAVKALSKITGDDPVRGIA